MKRYIVAYLTLCLIFCSIQTSEFPFYLNRERIDRMGEIIDDVKTALQRFNDINPNQGIVPAYMKIEENLNDAIIPDDINSLITSTLVYLFTCPEIPKIKDEFLKNNESLFIEEYYAKLQKIIEKQCDHQVNCRPTDINHVKYPILAAEALLRANDKPLSEQVLDNYQAGLYLLMYGKQITTDGDTRNAISQWLQTNQE